MKNFVWVGIVFFAFVMPLLIFLAERWLLRLKHLQKMALINILKRQQYMAATTFYATDIIKNCVKILYFKRGKAAHQALAELTCGRVTKAVEVLKEIHPQQSLLLLAHADLPKAFRQIKMQKEQKSRVSQCDVFLPMLACRLFKTQTFLRLLMRLERQKMDKSLLPYYDYMAAYAYLQDADMLSASQSADRALKAFQKKKYSFEEAQCYLAMAEIYRLSCINDVAQTMIESAFKIFKQLKNKLWMAQTTAIKGMLMVYESRWDEAESCYLEALAMAPTSTLEADILNQYALLQIVQNKLSAAKSKVDKALKVYFDVKNKTGQAFSYQLLGQVALQKQQYRTASKHCLLASDLYKILKNYAAMAESLYMAATANCRQEHYQIAEKYLRQILELNRQHQSSFHSANAYTMLGLIYLQTGDLQRAKALFQQSLHLEQRFERSEGLVADYANLALIEKLNGDNHASQNNLQIALEHARQTEDEDLIALIENKINMSN